VSRETGADARAAGVAGEVIDCGDSFVISSPSLIVCAPFERSDINRTASIQPVGPKGESLAYSDLTRI